MWTTLKNHLCIIDTADISVMIYFKFSRHNRFFQIFSKREKQGGQTGRVTSRIKMGEKKKRETRRECYVRKDRPLCIAHLYTVNTRQHAAQCASVLWNIILYITIHTYRAIGYIEKEKGGGRQHLRSSSVYVIKMARHAGRM